jgi:hypothetical protein
VKNSYPLPRIDDIFNQLTGAKFFSKIDLSSGYHQIRLHNDSIPKTAFRSRYGLFEFTVLHLGLTNSPSTFMSLMNDDFCEYLDKFVLIYLDDILIFSPTFEEHLHHLKTVLELLRRHKLYESSPSCWMWECDITVTGVFNQSNVRNTCSRNYCLILTL